MVEQKTVTTTAKEWLGFDPAEDRAPYFPSLTDGCPDVEEMRTHLEIEKEEPWVANFAPPIRQVCEEFHYNVILADLTVFQEGRRLVERGRPYLVNCIVCYRDTHAGEVLNAYHSVVNAMADTPIVPQESFYEDVLYLSRRIAPLRHPKRHIKAESQSARRRRTYYDPSATDTHGLGVNKAELSDRLRKLVTTFRRSLGEGVSISDQACIFLALPFHRAQYHQPIVVAAGPRGSRHGWRQSSGGQSPSPGGGLFLLLEPKGTVARRENTAQLASSLRLLLTMATLTESAARLDLQEQYSRMLSNMVHGTVTSIRAVNSANLWAALSDDSAGLSSLRFQIVRDGRRDEIAEQLLLDAAKLVRLGEETAVAMLALAEISALDGEVPQKHTSDSEVEVSKLLGDAKEMVNGLARQESFLNEISVSTSLPLPRHRLPCGYLDYRIVRGLLLEVLKNCSLHGSPQEKGRINVEVAMEFADDISTITVSITSPTVDRAWRIEDGISVPETGLGRKSFLLRLAEFGHMCGGIAVKTAVATGSGGHEYISRLSFGPLRVRKAGLVVEYSKPIRVD